MVATNLGNMGKTRIYELAKELGLENKAVLELCQRLEIEGKRSHSNSLDDGEAEKIRRFVIRQAVSGKKRGEEVTRADGTREKRMGNVIRRRKRSEEEVAAEEAAEAEKAKVKEQEAALVDSGAASIDIERNVGEAGEQLTRKDALAQANSIFSAQPEASAEPVEAVQEEQKEELEEEPEAAPVEAAKEEELVEEADPPLEVKAEEKSPDKPEGVKLGPKVLGRIDLPKKPEPEPKEEKESKSSPEEAAPKEASSRGGKGKKKGHAGGGQAEESARSRQRKKRKQVLSKVDLLDYDDERDAWRVKRDKRSKRGAGGAGAGRDASSAGRDSITGASKKVIKIDSEISVGDLAKAMGAKANQLILQLMNLGVTASISQLVDFDTATLVASEAGFTVINTGRDEEAFLEALKEDKDESALVTRPPVVTVMGHVDHGKTSLLDAIRETSVTEREAGGITQHIGAYMVDGPSGGHITFLDTPGHEAFTAMRSRGAQVTDVVVLVVAADDGVMPQTIEAINHAKAAEVPIIVAINKIDLEGANVERIRNELSEHGLVPEDWGGDTILVPVSAHTKEGIDLLLENLVLQSELLELKADPERLAVGAVLESKLEKGRGTVISVLVQSGTLKKGDPFVAGTVFGRVRALIDHEGNQLEEVGPSTPVEILGGSGSASAGDEFYVLESDAEAREISDARVQRQRLKETSVAAGAGVGRSLTLESFAEMVRQGDAKDLPVIVKADVQGSVEAISAALQRLSNDEVTVKIIHEGVGAISENDIQLSIASQALVVGFSVRGDTRATHLAEREGIEILYSRVIYEIVESVEKAVKGMLEPKFREAHLGRVEVRETFKVPRLGVIAGSYVLEGNVIRGSNVRLLRDSKVVFEGKMASLKRFKDDVKEVAAGYECGIGLEGYSDIKNGDILEVYKIEQVTE